jgi:hypothetical protein
MSLALTHRAAPGRHQAGVLAATLVVTGQDPDLWRARLDDLTTAPQRGQPAMSHVARLPSAHGIPPGGLPARMDVGLVKPLAAFCAQAASRVSAPNRWRSLQSPSNASGIIPASGRWVSGHRAVLGVERGSSFAMCLALQVGRVIALAKGRQPASRAIETPHALGMLGTGALAATHVGLA